MERSISSACHPESRARDLGGGPAFRALGRPNSRETFGMTTSFSIFHSALSGFSLEGTPCRRCTFRPDLRSGAQRAPVPPSASLPAHENAGACYAPLQSLPPRIRHSWRTHTDSPVHFCFNCATSRSFRAQDDTRPIGSRPLSRTCVGAFMTDSLRIIPIGGLGEIGMNL